MIREGYLEVFCGPMRCGKSRELISRLDRLKYMGGVTSLLVKPCLDTRDKKVKTRFGSLEISCKTIPETNPAQIFSLLDKDPFLVGIEEAQFFNNEIVFVIEGLLKQQRHVVVSGLDLDFRGESFGSMSEIMARANEVHKLTSICQYKHGNYFCNGEATRTQRLVNGKPADYKSPLILVGDNYEPRCLKHHYVPGKPLRFSLT